MSKENVVVKKRFVISTGMLGKGLTVEFTNKKGEVFALNQERLLSMPCFNEYGNYTNSNKLPSWAK